MKLKRDIKFPHRAVSSSWTPMSALGAYGLANRLPYKKQVVIAIVELGGGENKSDTSAAFAGWGLPAPAVTDVSVQGGADSPGGDADGEVALDIQIAAALFAGMTGVSAVVRTYYAPNGGSSAPFIGAVTQARLDKVDVVSISWGGPEDSWSAADKNAFDAELAACRAAGIPVFVAAGDNDSGDGESGVHVDFPASSPNAVGCGGTNKTSTSETVWNDGPGEGTGGGFSSFFPPQAFQVGAPASPADLGRLVPDVAGIADPNTGWQVLLNGSWQVIGGTSAVAPMWAGLYAGLKAAGLAMPTDFLGWLWQSPGVFTDITSGNNGAYQAAVGPDPCTGLGVPNIANMVAALSGATPPVGPPISPPPPVGPPVSPPPPPPPVLNPPSGGLGSGGILKEILAALKTELAALGIQIGNGKLLSLGIKVLLQYIASGGTETLQQIITSIVSGLIPAAGVAHAHFTMPTLAELEALVAKIENGAKVLQEVLAGLELAA